MNACADLELSLKRREGGVYQLEMRFSQPDSDTDIRVGNDSPVTATFDFEALRSLSNDAKAYGKALSEALFGDPAFRAAFGKVQASVQTLGTSLRLRLLLDYSAVELHNIRWETLQDPESFAPLFTGEQIFFSRYLSSADLRPVRLQAKGTLRALVAVADPLNIGEYSLAPIDIPGEMGRAKQALGDIPMTFLPAEGAPGEYCTMNRLLEHLREGYDILYLVAHGMFARNEPWIWLQDDQGKVARTSGTELATRLSELKKAPRLVVLASCQSAGNSAGDALLALGPRLAEAGVPAVLAMQGNVMMDTIAAFMPAFFKELYKDGQIDRAVAVARGTVRQQSDYWMPVLYMRLKSGRLWYTPGFAGSGSSFEKWPTVLNNLKAGRCTPILGPGLLESLMGSPREIALAWSERFRYPMAEYQREYLPQVAQFLAVNQSATFPRDDLNEQIRRRVIERYRGKLPENMLKPFADLKALLNAARQANVEQNGFDPYKLLAEFPLPVYITINSDDLLECALREAGRDPKTGICPWNEYIEQSDFVLGIDPGYRPSAAQPLVYHFFGFVDEPDSLVVTEDDLFNFLLGAGKNSDLIPKVVLNAFTSSSMLFLGFDLDSWQFRVLYRLIMSQPGGERRKRFPQVGAQVDLESGHIVDTDRARSYMESYFRDSDINLFWGSADDFMRELANQWKANS